MAETESSIRSEAIGELATTQLNMADPQDGVEQEAGAAAPRPPLQPRSDERGYSASLNWIDRLLHSAISQRFFEQFQALLHPDRLRRCGRHHVGNFTSEPNAVETANGSNHPGLTSKRHRKARMLTYPNDWANSSPGSSPSTTIWIRRSEQGTWTPQLTPAMAARR